MGIDAGVLVTHQITDEYRWQLAMSKIAQMFAGKEYFTNRLQDYMKPTCTNEDLRTVLLGMALFQKLEGEPGLIDNITEFVFEEDPLSPKLLKFLKLTEPLNFGIGGRDCTYNWARVEPAYNCSSELREKKRASWRGGPPLTLADFEQEMHLLKDKLQLCRMKNLSCEQDPDLKVFSSPGERAIRRDIKDLELLLSVLTALPEADQREILSASGQRLCPPDLFEFGLGEGPRLPLFARHFKSFQSKVTGSCRDVQPVLRQVFEVLKEFFPEHVMWFFNEHDEMVLQEPIAHFASRFFMNLGPSDFYQGMRVERREARPMCLKIVFRFGFCCFCGSQAHTVCGSCKVSQYCSKECQRKHWGEHKKHCM